MRTEMLESILAYKPKTFHLTKDGELSAAEIANIFDLAGKIKAQTFYNNPLQKKSLGMIFEKNSTRTRVSFEVGMYQLGGNAIYLGKNDIQLSRGESLEDTARVLSRYLDGIMIRSISQTRIDLLAQYSSIPVINGLSDLFHPCQALADFFTISEIHHGPSNFCYIGDAANNVARSLAITGAILGHNVTFCSPEEYRLPDDIYQQCLTLSQSHGGQVIRSSDTIEAIQGCDFLYTDVWVSMGDEEQKQERFNKLSSYQINQKLIDHSGSQPNIMHCLPAQWGNELGDDLKNYSKNIIFDQAENRMHIQKALLATLLTTDPGRLP